MLKKNERETNLTFLALLFLLSLSIFQSILPFNFESAGAASSLIFKVNQAIFIPGDSLVLYGKGFPKDMLLLELRDPSGKTLRIDSVSSDENGYFTTQVFVWPQPSRNYVFGSYTLQLTSSSVPTESSSVSFLFAGEDIRSGTVGESLPHVLTVKLDSPAQVTTNSTFRIFVQVTFDGALVSVNPDSLSQLLGTSHIHGGSLSTSGENGSSALSAPIAISLADKFSIIHDGLYYADVKLDEDGVYIIHAVAFYNGFLSHDSRVITASPGSIGSIQRTVNELNSKLESTRIELDETKKALVESRNSIKDDIARASETVDQMQAASGQINSIILPVLVLISIIIALQISLFERIRASYK